MWKYLEDYNYLAKWIFNGKELKAKHIIFVHLFHSNAGKNVIYKYIYLRYIRTRVRVYL
jgi:hypothetical protein